MIRVFVNRALLRVALGCLRAHARLGGQAPHVRWFLAIQRQKESPSPATQPGYVLKEFDPITEQTLETRQLLLSEIARFSKMVGERTR